MRRVGVAIAIEDRREFDGAHRVSRFLEHLPLHRGGGTVPDIRPAAGKRPAAIGALPDEQDPIVPKHGSTHIHLRRRIALLRRENSIELAGGFLRSAGIADGARRNHLGRNRANRLEPLPIESIVRERETALCERLEPFRAVEPVGVHAPIEAPFAGEPPADALHSPGAMSSDAVEVFRATRRADCEERAFVLFAVGVPSEIIHVPERPVFARLWRREPWSGGGSASWGAHYALLVEPRAFADARNHLMRYEEERRPRPAPPPLSPPRLHAHAWIGCLAYAAVLLWVSYAVNGGLWRLDAFDVGDLYAAAVRQGQLWRAWTALTLHLDVGHIVANLGAGIWFGWLAGRLLGPGTAWALIVNGAAAANLIEGLLAVPEDRSAGASTAVFTALGLLAAYSWWERRRLPQHWARAWGPLIAGVVLLGWFGTEGEHTDVFAHLAGFCVGALLGTTAAVVPVRRVLERVPQWIGGALALGAIAAAWAFALHS